MRLLVRKVSVVLTSSEERRTYGLVVAGETSFTSMYNLFPHLCFNGVHVCAGRTVVCGIFQATVVYYTQSIPV